MIQSYESHDYLWHANGDLNKIYYWTCFAAYIYLHIRTYRAKTAYVIYEGNTIKSSSFIFSLWYLQG